MIRTRKTVAQSSLELLCLCLLFTLAASAQQSNSTQEQLQLATTSAVQTDDEPSAQSHAPDETEAAKTRRGSFVAAPIPTSSAALGAGVTIVAGYLFPLNKNDKISPPSVIGGAALITNNGTRAFAVGTELYFKEDRYHVLAGVAHGDLNYDFYGTGYRAGSAGIKFGLNQKGTAFFGEIMRRIGWQIFVGPRVWMGKAELAPQHLNENHPELPPLNVSFDMRAIGLKVERDTTPNRFYPTKGTMLHFSADFFSKGLGGSFTFQTYRLTFNSYHSFGEKQVLAYNAFMCTTGGQAPFFGECIFGMQNEL